MTEIDNVDWSEWDNREESESTTCQICKAKKVFPLDVQTEVGNDEDGYYTIQLYACVACGSLSSRAEIINCDELDEIPF